MPTQRRFVNQFMPGEVLDQVFLVCAKDMRTSKTGDLYLSCTLGDRTGQLPARMWKISEGIFNSVPVGGFVHVKGRTDEYRGALQMIIDALRPLASDKVNLADFIAVTPMDIEAMWSELLEILRDVKDRDCRMLIKKFAEDRDLVAGFKRSPAAMTMHHAYVGGLLEHTLAVARAARTLMPMYPALNADLVLTGVFLHDIGKVAELSSGTSIQYTDRGQLVGHITIAAMWVAAKADEIARETGQPLPEKTLDLLLHILLSHHGVHEYGSPKLPMIPEAFFIHYLDNLDAKMWMTANQIANDADPAASFTAYSPQLECRLYKHSGRTTDKPQ